MSDNDGVAATQQTMLADRYGAPAPWRRRVLVGAVAALCLAFAAWLGWTIWEQARPLVSSGEFTYEVEGENAATAEFVVEYRDGDDAGTVKATCTLKAYAADHTLVGQLSFTPDADADGRVVQRISTDRRASSVELVGCTAPGQPRPR